MTKDKATLAKEYHDSYHHRKRLGLCVINGCPNDGKPGKTMCQRHIDIKYERELMIKVWRNRLVLGICAIPGAEPLKPTTTQDGGLFGLR